MKFRPIYIAIIVVLFIIIMLVSSAGTTFVPYSKDTLFSHEFIYEGMKPGAAAGPGVAAEKTGADSYKPPMYKATEGDASDVAQPASVTQRITGFFGYPSSKSCDGPKCMQTEGFALQPAPFDEYPTLDRYGKTPSGPECVGQGSGYSKSLGPLCMSEEDKRMLSTRGGNSTGEDIVIGQQ